MGFDTRTAREALEQCGSFEGALDKLLNSAPSSPSAPSAPPPPPVRMLEYLSILGGMKCMLVAMDSRFGQY